MFKFFTGLSDWDQAEVISLAIALFATIFGLRLKHKKTIIVDENGLIPVALFFRKKEVASKKAKYEFFWDIVLILGLFSAIPVAWHRMSVIAKLNNENLRLQLKLQPRTVSIEQITNFVYLTEKITKIPIKICLTQNGDTPETETFAFQIRDMLTKANFGINSDAGIWDITRGEPDLFRKTERQKVWPDVLFVFYSTNNCSSPQLNDFVFDGNLYQETNSAGAARTGFTGKNSNVIYAILMNEFITNGITSQWLHKNELVKPGECEIIVLPKDY
ncbi:MAG TPA: hypothetical protein VIK59_10590 [Verrucomicrobiae bacterium]